MAKARIKLASTDQKLLNEMCSQISDIAKQMKVKVSGPVPLPRKVLKIPTRFSPDAEGRETFETWEMRIYNRLIDVDSNEKVLKHIMRISIPKNINIEIQFID